MGDNSPLQGHRQHSGPAPDPEVFKAWNIIFHPVPVLRGVSKHLKVQKTETKEEM